MRSRLLRPLAALPLLALPFLAACGDDDDGGGGGNEERYVRTLCTAFNDFNDSFVEILTDPENQDVTEEEGIALFEEPFANFVAAIDRANPPSDIREYHQSLVRQMQQGLEQIRSGDTDALAEVEVPEPSQEVQTKYERIAADIPECKDAQLFE